MKLCTSCARVVRGLCAGCAEVCARISSLSSTSVPIYLQWNHHRFAKNHSIRLCHSGFGEFFCPEADAPHTCQHWFLILKLKNLKIEKMKMKKSRSHFRHRGGRPPGTLKKGRPFLSVPPVGKKTQKNTYGEVHVLRSHDFCGLCNSVWDAKTDRLAPVLIAIPRGLRGIFIKWREFSFAEKRNFVKPVDFCWTKMN